MEKKTPYNPNNKTELPLNHYLELFRAGDPAEMAKRTGAGWDGERFTLTVCGETKTVTWPEFSDGGWTDTQRILFLRYLLIVELHCRVNQINLSHIFSQLGQEPFVVAQVANQVHLVVLLAQPELLPDVEVVVDAVVGLAVWKSVGKLKSAAVEHKDVAASLVLVDEHLQGASNVAFLEEMLGN